MSDLDRRRRIRRARVLVRLEFSVAFAALVVAGLCYVAAPGWVGGGLGWEPSLLEQLVPWSGVGGTIVGLAWMVRLSRSDPEAGEREWRYRGI